MQIIWLALGFDLSMTFKNRTNKKPANRMEQILKRQQGKVTGRKT